MFGLEKFDGSQSGLQRIREFLLRQRAPIFREELNSSSESTHSGIIGMDESFQKLLDMHKNKKRIDIDDNKENMEMMNISNKMKVSPLLSNKLNIDDSPRTSYYSHNDSTLLEEPSMWRQTTDESFEDVERMCNLTIPNKQMIDEDEETKALNRLLSEFNETRATNHMKMNLADQTQLNDIEAPSGFWENTMNVDQSAIQTSPVKMVGLMRPSTIMEESLEVSADSDNSSNSYRSAQKIDTTSTDQYDTANETAQAKSCFGAYNSRILTKSNDDTMAGSEPCSFHSRSNISVSSTETSTSKHEFDLFPQRKYAFFDEPLISSQKSADSDSIELPRRKILSSASSSLLDDSLNVVVEAPKYVNSFDDSLNMPTVRTNAKDISSEMNEEYDLIDLEQSVYIPVKCEQSELDTVISADDSCILVSEDDNSLANDSNASNLNVGFSMQFSHTEDSDGNCSSIVSPRESGLSISGEFNDTIEKMEYMMKKGLKLLSEKDKKTPIGLGGDSYSPLSRKILTTPSPIASPKTPSTIVAKPKRFPPTTSIEQFKKPISSTKKALPKAVSALKKPTNFGHIISPVGAYIKNTPTAPMTSSIKPTGGFCKINAIRELNFNAGKQNTPKKPETSKATTSRFPRKAYVSAEYKHVVDERVPVTIPGGEKIHQYLYSSKIPSVIRHEGKIKMNLTSDRNAANNRSVDSSLADLSLMSGDVSVLVLKDAKRF